MHIDWSTLALQTINVLILIWILARFLFRPLQAIIAKRQAQTDKVLAEAAATRAQAAESKAAADEIRSEIEAQRQQLMIEAQSDAAKERARQIETVKGEISKLRAEAAEAAETERAAMEDALIAEVKALAMEIARRLLTRIPPDAGLETYIDGLCDRSKNLAAEIREAFLSQSEKGEPIEVVTAAALSDEAAAHLRAKLKAAFGSDLALTFSTDAAVIAGIELNGQTVSLRNSLRQDLDHIAKELDFGVVRPR